MLLGTWKYKYPFDTLLLILWGMYPEVELELLDHMVILFLFFCRATILFSIVAASFYIPTSNAQGVQFLHFLIKICYFPFFFLIVVI